MCELMAVIVRGTESTSVGDGHEDTQLFETKQEQKKKTSTFSTVLWDEKSNPAMLGDKRLEICGSSFLQVTFCSQDGDSLIAPRLLNLERVAWKKR